MHNQQNIKISGMALLMVFISSSHYGFAADVKDAKSPADLEKEKQQDMLDSALRIFLLADNPTLEESDDHAIKSLTYSSNIDGVQQEITWYKKGDTITLFNEIHKKCQNLLSDNQPASNSACEPRLLSDKKVFVTFSGDDTWLKTCISCQDLTNKADIFFKRQEIAQEKLGMFQKLLDNKAH